MIFADYLMNYDKKNHRASGQSIQSQFNYDFR